MHDQSVRDRFGDSLMRLMAACLQMWMRGVPVDWLNIKHRNTACLTGHWLNTRHKKYKIKIKTTCLTHIKRYNESFTVDHHDCLTHGVA